MNQTLKSENVWTGLACQLTRCQPISRSVSLPSSCRGAPCTSWTGSWSGPGCSSPGGFWRIWLVSPWRSGSTESKASWGNLDESEHERSEVGSEEHLDSLRHNNYSCNTRNDCWTSSHEVDQDRDQDPVLTFSFLPLYGFFTNSMASTMSSVIVLYLRTWETKTRQLPVINKHRSVINKRIGVQKLLSHVKNVCSRGSSGSALAKNASFVL